MSDLLALVFLYGIYLGLASVYILAYYVEIGALFRIGEPRLKKTRWPLALAFAGLACIVALSVPYCYAGPAGNEEIIAREMLFCHAALAQFVFCLSIFLDQPSISRGTILAGSISIWLMDRSLFELIHFHFNDRFS